MSNKKNKTQQKAANSTTEDKEKKATVTVEVKKEEKKNPKPGKTEKKVDPTPPPVETEDPSVETTTVEEIKKEAETTIPTKTDLSKIKLQSSQYLSGDGYARLLDVAQRRIASMKSDEPATIKMEQLFDYNLAWAMTKATIQAREEKLTLGIAVPNDDVIVQDVIDTFNNLGVALSPHVSEDGRQMKLEFKDIDPQTVKDAKEEIKQEKVVTPPELDPTKWTSDADAKKALSWILTRSNTPFPNRFNECLMKVKQYRQNQESDPKKKETWDQIGLGALFEDAVALLGNKSTALVRGLCQGSVASLIADHNPIFSHCTIKYNLPVLSDKEVADLLKSFIKVRQEDSSQPIDESPAVKNGILEPTREFFLQVPLNAENPVVDYESNGAEVALAKKIMNKFKEAYKSEFSLADPKFHIKVTNKMIDIRNLYVDANAAYAEYTEDEYPKTIAATVEKPE